MAQMLLFVHTPVEVLELHLPIIEHGVVQTIHVVVDTLVHILNAAGHQHLPLQLTCLMTTGEALQTADQLLALLTGDELRRLHRIHQQTELGHIQRTLADIIPHGGVPHRQHVLAQQAQLLQIVVQTLALGGDTFLLQQILDLLEGQRMLLVRLPPQNLQQIQQFQFLVGLSCHSGHPLCIVQIMSHHTIP